jgi:hypothetical protein
MHCIVVLSIDVLYKRSFDYFEFFNFLLEVTVQMKMHMGLLGRSSGSCWPYPGHSSAPLDRHGMGFHYLSIYTC